MSDAAPSPDIRVVSPSATAEDIAAVTVVVTQALAELAEELGAEQGPVVSAWQRSQRSLRGAVHAAPGNWRGFSA